MAKAYETGKEGEYESRVYLQKNGYNILHTNWHYHHFELDIVAEKDGMLVVVEVKTRSSDYLVSPEDSVDNRKIRRIVSAADSYVRYFNLAMPVRFDIISLVKNNDGSYVVEEHFEDAFFAPIK